MKTTSRLTAIGLAVFVTFLWSTSWVLIKIGLSDRLPPLTFAGLRYTLASLCMLPVLLFNPTQRSALKALTRRDVWKLGLLGVILITVTQGAQFLALDQLPANMVSLLLNLTPIFVALAGIRLLKEQPGWHQWLGIGLTTLGAGIYFFPFQLSGDQLVGIAIGLLCMFANVASSLMGREVNRGGVYTAGVITFVSMSIGSILLLGIGLIFERPGIPTLVDWAIIAWMAVMNTALAFTLWNVTLQVLTAVESSIVNSLMMPQIAILAWLFLGETFSQRAILGLVLVSLGTLVVQLKRNRDAAVKAESPVPQDPNP